MPMKPAKCCGASGRPAPIRTWCGSGSARCAASDPEEAIGEFVAECAGRVVSVGEVSEIDQTRVERAHDVGRGGEYLAPMGPCVERRELRLDGRRHGRHHVDVRYPGEMDADAVALIATAEPQTVCCDRAQLGDLQDRSDEITNGVDRTERVGRGAAGDEVLRLKFIAVARREVEPKMWKAFVPRPGHTELLGAMQRRDAGHRMARAVSGS